MQAERYAQVKALFNEICDLPEAERDERLLARAGDPELVRQVRALLAQEQAQTHGFAAPIVGLLGALASETLEPGTTLGAWTLIHKIGEGGMGSVYQARRSDGHFEQTAAIKVLRGLPSTTAMEYLARERQILAGLAHPNIARLLDGGATPAGQPYLVMEYLDGVPLDRYSQTQQLPTAAILRLLRAVCDAVGFAHQRLIVHCDLKPSNILVTADGRPCLLDFGIARLLDRELPDGGPSSASLRARAFTPGFASPEQESGGPLSTASDIYSLGRLLEALLGTQRLTADAELRAIVSLATQADPLRRYASADALAQDLQRYLSREPLTAVAPSWGYRTRKLLQRRWPVALAGAVFACVVAAFTWQLARDRDRALAAEQQALAERDRATQAQAASKQISEFLVSMLDGANPDAGGGEIPTSKLVEQALARIDTELAGQPAVQAELYGTLAGVQSILGNPQAAQTSFLKAIELERPLARPLVLADLLDQLAALRRRSFSLPEAEGPAREALALFEQHAGPNAPELIHATAQLGTVLSQTGKQADGKALLRLALRRAEALNPDGPETAVVLQELALHLTRANEYAQAETLLRRALVLRASGAGSDADALSVQEQLGALLGKQGRVAEAEILLRGALEQRRALFGADDVNIPWRLSELARVLDNNGEPQRALPLYREALAIAERKMGPTSIPYAVLLNNLALATMRVGDYAESERHYRQAIAIVSEPWGESSEGLASLRFNLATLLAKTRPDEALKLLRLCEAVYAKAYPAQHVEVIATRLMLAVVSAEARDLQGARTWLQRVDAAQAELQPLTRADRAYAQARVLQLEGQMDAALAELERAETLRAQALDAADPRIWLAQIERAEWLVTRGHAGDAAASAALAREILTHLDTILVPDSPVRKRLAALM